MTESKRLYESDYHAWIEYSIEQTKNIGLTEIADHLEEMSRTEKREIRNRFVILIMHLLKWKYQPEKQTRSWRNSIDISRIELEQIFRDSPSLRPKAYQFALDAYPIAKKKAEQETLFQVEFPDELEFSLEELMGQK